MIGHDSIQVYGLHIIKDKIRLNKWKLLRLWLKTIGLAAPKCVFHVFRAYFEIYIVIMFRFLMIKYRFSINITI